MNTVILGDKSNKVVYFSSDMYYSNKLQNGQYLYLWLSTLTGQCGQFVFGPGHTKNRYSTYCFWPIRANFCWQIPRLHWLLDSNVLVIFYLNRRGCYVHRISAHPLWGWVLLSLRAWLSLIFPEISTYFIEDFFSFSRFGSRIVEPNVESMKIKCIKVCIMY